MGIAEFCSLVGQVLLFANGSVVSWLRSEKRNVEVGGHLLSLHRVGLAVDVVFDQEIDKVMGMRMAERLGLLVIDEGEHVHIQVGHNNGTDDP